MEPLLLLKPVSLFKESPKSSGLKLSWNYSILESILVLAN